MASTPDRKKSKSLKILLASAAAMAGVAVFGVNGEDNPQTLEGTENLDRYVPFAQIDTLGDARLKYVIGRLRSVPAGEDLYQEAARTGAKISWQADTGNAAGLYQAGRMDINPDAPNDKIVYTIVHELRHHWQYNNTYQGTLRLDPASHYRMEKMGEIDACAYSAYFMAQFNDTQKNRLNVTPTSYGIETAIKFAQTPPGDRSYLTDAYGGCFKEIGEYSYDETHYERVRVKFNQITNAVQASGDVDSLRSVQQTYFSPADDRTRAQLFREFFVTDVKTNTIIPAIRNASDDELMAWLARQTPSNHAPSLNTMQNGYYSMMKRIDRQIGLSRPAQVTYSTLNRK